jgi:hypothetical protein
MQKEIHAALTKKKVVKQALADAQLAIKELVGK